MADSKSQKRSFNSGLILFGLLIIAQCLVFSRALLWYAQRVENSIEEAFALLLSAGIVATHVNYENLKRYRPTTTHLYLISFAFALYALFHNLGLPSILKSAIALCSLMYSFAWALKLKLNWGFWSMCLLSLPLVPTLQFFLGYPARLISASLTVPLLQMNGYSVIREGVFLNWQGELLQFDAPCSSVIMLWAGLYLCSVMAFIYHFRFIRFGLAMALSCLLILFANIIRASSLFYLDNLSTTQPQYWQHSWQHESLGVVSFIGAAGLIIFTLRSLRPSACDSICIDKS